MSVTLIQPYLNYPRGVTVSLQADVEASLIAQGIAVASSSVAGEYTLPDGPIIPWDLSLAHIAQVTLGGNRTMAAPSNLDKVWPNRTTFILHVYQDSVGSRTLTFPATSYQWPGGVAPILTTTAGAHDVISFVSDGTHLIGSLLPSVS